MRRAFKNLFKRFQADETASITMEFVLILPVLVTWFIGSIVFYDAYNSKATAQRTAHTIADIISRQTDTSNNIIDSLLLVQNRMSPRAAVGSVRISSIQRNSAGILQMQWTHATDGSTPLTLADIPLTVLPVINNGESVLLVDTTVPFAPISDWTAITTTNWVNRVSISPRFVEPLPNSDFP
jgi:Flp pilus assembly protein TadG